MATTAASPIPSASLKKSELQDLIQRAAQGDQDSARRLVSPFVGQGEKLVNFGITAKFGILPTYDFLFLTDRQIGDLEITPITGNLSVEVAYLRKIDAFILRQPGFPILLRLFLFSSYLWFPYVLFAFGNVVAGAIFGEVPWFLVGIPSLALGVFAAYAVVNPALMRSYLRLRKSGLYLLLRGTSTGVLIFADRDKFEMLTRVLRQVSEFTRRLDTELM